MLFFNILYPCFVLFFKNLYMLFVTFFIFLLSICFALDKNRAYIFFPNSYYFPTNVKIGVEYRNVNKIPKILLIRKRGTAVSTSINVCCFVVSVDSTIMMAIETVNILIQRFISTHEKETEITRKQLEQCRLGAQFSPR